MATYPPVGRSRPRISRIVVDLPAPFGPRKPVTRPGCTVNDRLSTPCVFPYRLLSARASITRFTLPAAPDSSLRTVHAARPPQRATDPLPYCVPVRQCRRMPAGSPPPQASCGSAAAGTIGAVIERYTLPEMGRIWSDGHKYELWCRVETLVLQAHVEAGTVPAWAVEPVRAAPPPTPEAVAAIEAVTEHDVIAFLSAWADNTTPREAAAYVHFGLTSSDLLDTALALQLTEATDLLIGRAVGLTAALREHALAHRGTLRPGRTHGIHAEPDVWGHRVADFAFAMARCCERLRRARRAVAVGKLSGPVGTYSSIDPPIEAAVMAGLGLRPADVATQVVLRDGISEWVSVLAIIATVCEAVRSEE